MYRWSISWEASTLYRVAKRTRTLVQETRKVLISYVCGQDFRKVDIYYIPHKNYGNLCCSRYYLTCTIFYFHCTTYSVTLVREKNSATWQTWSGTKPYKVKTQRKIRPRANVDTLVSDTSNRQLMVGHSDHESPVASRGWPAQLGERRVKVRGGGGRQRLRALRRHADVLLQQPSATTPGNIYLFKYQPTTKKQKVLESTAFFCILSD